MPGLTSPRLTVPTLTAPDDYAAAILGTPGLLAYWPLDDAAGSATVRDVAAGRALTWQGGSAVPAAPLRRRGRASATNAVTTYAVASSAALFALSTVTVEAWLATTVPGVSFRGIVAKSNAYGLFLKDGELGAWNWGVTGPAGWQGTGRLLNDGYPHHVAFSVQSGVVAGSTIYLDGVPVTTTQYSTNNQGTALDVGAAGVVQQITASLSDAAVYDRVLSPAEVREHYELGAL